jgi:DNA uptake protein ComE-like DNA-binding protein
VITTTRRTTIAAAALLLGLVVQGAQAQVGKNIGLLDPNRATRDELAALPGIDAALADQIIAGRPWLDMMKFDAVLASNLNEQQREALYRRLWAPLNLNTASKEEILLIPGVGDRMLHEFEEYRPYPALVRFHREIDKYVDDAELARLEQYVFVPIDLNMASDEDIMTIPGMGPRMLREFKEYRPYRSMDQFRREIGKYVDEKEVARLEHYVMIRQ